MAFTQQQLDILNSAIAQGALTVEYADKKVTYRSLNEMLNTRNIMMQELGIVKPNSGRRYADYRSGLNNC